MMMRMRMRMVGAAIVTVVLLVVASTSVNAANFLSDVELTWGDGRAKILDNGNELQLTLDRYSGSGFQSKQEYLFGRFDMDIKVVPGDAAGLVTTCYLSSKGTRHDEIDFEFLGNSSGHPYTLHTNIFSDGKGNREQEFKLWFDARLDFHTYSIVWSPSNVIWYVDGTAIREFKNVERQLGVPYLNSQPQRLYSSLWNGEGWVTKGGQVKTNWSKAPFTASYRNFNARSIVGLSSSTLDTAGLEKMKMVQNEYMIYDYCKDSKRFPRGFPPECSLA